MFLLTTKFVKNSHLLAIIPFIFLKNVQKPTYNSLNPGFPPQLKYWESSYQVRPILGFFGHLISLIVS